MNKYFTRALLAGFVLSTIFIFNSFIQITPAGAQGITCLNIDSFLAAVGVTDPARIEAARIAFGCPPTASPFTVELVGQNLVLISSNEIDGEQALGTFKFKVTAVNQDVLINKVQKDSSLDVFKDGSFVGSPTAVNLSVGGVGTGSDTADYYVINEGDSREFKLNYVINPTQGSGVYYAKATSIFLNGVDKYYFTGFESNVLYLNSSSASGCPLILTRDLTVGSTGADVTALQNFLGVTPTTGYFGPILKSAVIAYQNAHGISPADGFVGPLTRAFIAKVDICTAEIIKVDVQMIDNSTVDKIGGAFIDLSIKGFESNKQIDHWALNYVCLKGVTLEDGKGYYYCDGSSDDKGMVTFYARNMYDVTADYKMCTLNAQNKTNVSKQLNFSLYAYDSAGTILGSDKSAITINPYPLPVITNNPLSVACTGQYLPSGLEIKWSSNIAGGSGTKYYQWTVDRDAVVTGGTLKSSSVSAKYGSTGVKTASVKVSDNAGFASDSCSLDLVSGTTPIEPEPEPEPEPIVDPVVDPIVVPVTPSACAYHIYSDYGACSGSGVKYRKVISSYPAGCTGGVKPSLSTSCNPFAKPASTTTSSLESNQDYATASLGWDGFIKLLSILR